MSDQATLTYAVTGMTCGHCESAVRDEVSALEGVEVLEVSASAGTLTIQAPADLDDAAVVAAVDEAGYAATRSA